MFHNVGCVKHCPLNCFIRYLGVGCVLVYLMLKQPVQSCVLREVRETV